jgi:hypothetical protein
MKRIAQHPPMLGKHLGITLGADLAKQPRRTLYIGELERDSAVGKLVHSGRRPAML